MPLIRSPYPDAAAGGPVLAGLYQWSDADSAALGAVSSWSDLSGNSRPWTQSTGGSQPTNQSGQANGHNALLFNGTSSYLSLADVLSGLTAGEIFIVRKEAVDPPTDTTKTGLWTMQTAAQGSVSPYTDGNIYDGWGSTARKSAGPPGTALNVWHVYNVASGPGEWTARINGTQIYTTATNTVGFNTAPDLGRSYVNAGEIYWLNAQLAAILIYDHVLTSGDRATNMTYFHGRFGTP